MAVLLLILAFAASLSSVDAQVGCRNAAGNPVDWWIALKAPEGSLYGYIDSDQSPPAWAYDPNSHLADTSGNPLAETVQQIYQSGTGYVIYNDQPFRFKPKPRIDGKFHAHAKGVIAFQGPQGFWLTHSNPNWPDDPKSDTYTGIYDCEASHPEKCGPAEGQQRYGQSYLCMTMNADELEKAAKLIQISEVVVAGADLQGFENQYPEVNQIVTDYDDHHTGVAPPEDTQHQTIQTARGEALLQFAMSPTAVGDDVYLYEQLIEPELKSGLLVETWKEGKDFPSYCPSDPSSIPEGEDFGYETRTINKISINADLTWTNSRTRNSGDHSKWAITHAPGGLDGCSMAPGAHNITTARKLLYAQDCEREAAQKKVLCVADINRAGHQLQRGGGAVCFTKNAALWEAFVPIVAAVGECGEL